MDEFSGYNQIKMLPEDQEKTAFTTPWGTFMYAKIPFALMNAGATFQRVMDIAFVDERDRFVVFTWMILLYILGMIRSISNIMIRSISDI